MDEQALIEYLKSPTFIKASANATRLVAKLESAVKRKELYETHQILRTINFRFIGYKEKIVALQSLLYEGACYLLKSGEHVSGQDIGTLFLEVTAKCLQRRNEENADHEDGQQNSSLAYDTNRQTLDYEISQKVAHIAISLPDTEIGQSRFIADTLKILTPKLVNRNLLHEVLATNFWRTEDLANSRYHYLHCANLLNAKDIASLLVEYQTKRAIRSEIDLFITQFILQFTCLQDPRDPPNSKKTNNLATTATNSISNNTRKSRGEIKLIAEKIFSSYALQHPNLSQVCVPFTSLPLLNFTYFIISILDLDKEASTFIMLRDIYRITWSRDPNYDGYLSRIETLYFGVVDQTKQRQGGFFNNILLSLLDEADDDDEESDLEVGSNNNSNNNNNFYACDELD